MIHVYLGLGSNLGNCEKNLQTAVEKINQTFPVLKQSKCLWTDPQYVTTQPRFLNQVILIQTNLAPLLLLEFLKNIEKSMGREISFRYGPRLIDIDILYYGNDVFNNPQLTIPHPEISFRDFVLIPLSEIADNFICPIPDKKDS